MKKIKSIISFVLAFCLIIPTMFLLTACGKSSVLSNDSGFEIEGGGFKKGSVLNTNKLENTAEDADKVYDKLEGFGVGVSDKSKAYIYDIYVSKDDKKVQPDGKVKVKVKVTENAGGYKVYHIKDDDTVEELEATYKDGVLTFETSSFSYYVFVAADAINPIATAGSEAEWNKAINYWQAQNNVKVVERISNLDHDDLGAQIMLYQLKDNVYSYDGYYEADAASKDYKGKALYIVKDGETYYRVEWSDGKSEDDGEWKKSDYNAENMYMEALERNIYKCIDFYAQPLDLNYANFSYDATNKIYKNSDNSVNVAFTFESGVLTKIVVTVFLNDEGTMRTSTRTITFGNAEVNVPTVSE